MVFLHKNTYVEVITLSAWFESDGSDMLINALFICGWILGGILSETAVPSFFESLIMFMIRSIVCLIEFSSLISYDLVRTDHTAKQVKELIVASFANSNIPNVEITDCNYEDAGKLYLKHRHAGVDLQLEYAKKTVKHINELWGRDVILECIIGKIPTLISCISKSILTATVGPIGEDKDDTKTPASAPTP